MNDTTPKHHRTPLCEYSLNEIAAELVWRATRPPADRPWRPGFLLQHEARVLADIAVADALRVQEDAGDPVHATDDGCAFLTGAAQVVLDRIEPGRWRAAVGECGRRAEVSVTEREAGCNCFGRYVRVGVVLVDPTRLPDKRREPRMLSSRARGVVEVVRTWERCHSGKGVRDAASTAIRDARELTSRLDAGLEPDLGADACDLSCDVTSC